MWMRIGDAGCRGRDDTGSITGLVRRALLGVAMCLLPMQSPEACGTDAARPRGRTYYVSTRGRDTNPGSLARPWRTLARVARGTYRPGDRVLLRGGQTFTGSLYLDEATCRSTAESPLTIGSYGGGRATVASGNASALVLAGLAGIRIEDLVIVGTSLASRSSNSNGIHVMSFAGRRRGISVRRVDVSGYLGYGILVQGKDASNGIDGVRITGVRAHGNGFSGIGTLGEQVGAVKDVYVGDCEADHNPGFTSEEGDFDGGGGIYYAAVDGGVIENNDVHDNGSSGSGIFGVQVWMANGVTIQYNRAARNHTATAADGGAYDLDGGVSSSIVQYNYSTENDGPGVLVCPCVLGEGPGAAPMHDNVVRYNISINDGRRNAAGGLAFAGGNPTNNVAFYNNVVFIDGQNPEVDAAVVVSGLDWGVPYRNVQFYNNLLITRDAVPLVTVMDPQSAVDLVFLRNCYAALDGSYVFRWNHCPHSSCNPPREGELFRSLDAWASRTGLETSRGTVMGLTGDPGVCGAGGVDPRSYLLQPSSRLIDAGIDIGGMGSRDFFGNSLIAGTSPDIGVHESQPGQDCP